MLNKCFLMGRLVADPELRHTQSGTAVANFRLAVDRDFKDKDTGERKADFINVTAWRSTAEFVSKYFSKGRMAVVVGSLQVRSWEDKDGNRRTAAEVVADSIYFGDSGGKRSEPEGNAPERSFPPASVGFADADEDDGELPF
ncbi:single-stranded DNA-binding protein [uncultured Intestinimonas sp.]|uniref:single-stranded DNA-binding protein n=1 Tax=uncultured Intestinimonas sp. TaxID=1689265 RepID=UPI0029430D17|nr:single-stranded DNA-binding protein [uncultured Intestinimonas sp.]